MDLDPNLADAYYALGRAWAHKGDHDQAIVDYDQAIALNQKSADFYNARGESWKAKGNRDRAEADRKMAVGLQGK
ncbi:tetratricopeptide repeat protein [Mesorhizobium tamadayense]|uniref:tetratricopeptide repeat protein n=1 Tax=Mesorhizobium tamadayense TaxID=425306 RepID=UPI00142E793F